MAMRTPVVLFRVLPRCRSVVSASVSTRRVHAVGENATPSTAYPPLTPEQKELLDSMLRVDHAGELGANWIYKGQLAVLGKDAKVGPVIEVGIAALLPNMLCQTLTIIHFTAHVGPGETSLGRL